MAVLQSLILPWKKEEKKKRKKKKQQTLLKHKYTDNVTDSVFVTLSECTFSFGLFPLLCIKYIFVWFYRSIGFEGNNIYAKKVLPQRSNALTLQLSLSMSTWLIRSCFFPCRSRDADSPRPALNHAICNVYSKRCWNINTRTMLQILCSLFCGIYFLLVWALDSNGMINTLKRCFVAMECADVVAFTFGTWQIRSCLLCELIRPEAIVMTLFAILCLSLVG